MTPLAKLPPMHTIRDRLDGSGQPIRLDAASMEVWLAWLSGQRGKPGVETLGDRPLAQRLCAR